MNDDQRKVIELYVFGGDHEKHVRALAIEVKGGFEKAVGSLAPGEFFYFPHTLWEEERGAVHRMSGVGMKQCQKALTCFRVNEDGSIPDTLWTGWPVFEMIPEYVRELMRSANTSMAECWRREEEGLDIKAVVKERLGRVFQEVYDEHPFTQQTEEERNRLKVAVLQKIQAAFPLAHIEVLEADLTLDFSEYHINFVLSDEVGYEELRRAVEREAHRG